MAAGDATASDVPGKYDVVLNGKGYCFADSVEPSLPFRTHRAIYDVTPPFVERSNVSNSYGDNAQDFFLTIRQRNWSLGEQQEFFRAGQDGRYWQGSNVDISRPGRVTLTRQTPSLTFAAAAVGGCQDDFSGDRSSVVVATSTNLYRVRVDGSITDLGAHGLGAAPAKYAVANDAANTYISTTAAGTVGVRKWNGAAYSTFSASGADSLCVLNNTLFGYRASNSDLVEYSTAGVLTSIFPWKSPDGSTGATATNINTPILKPYGGKILILFPYTQEAAELWVYDGTAPTRLEVFPANFAATSMVVQYGIVYIGGNFLRSASTTTMNIRPAVLFFDGGNLGLLWRANAYGTTALTATTIPTPGPALGTSDSRVVFTDDIAGLIMAYDPAQGGVSAIGSYTPGTANTGMVSTGSMALLTLTTTTGYYFPHATTYNTTGNVVSSLIDFDSSLPKQFRGIKVEFDAGSDGDGGSVDIAYQTDSLTGSWTTLKTGAVSGTEYTLTNISGHAIAVRVTLNKGTSTAGPTLRSMTVRAVPQMPIYRSGLYVLDCSGSEDQPQEVRDGSYHPLTGYEQAQNLYTAATSTAPFSVTDKLGTFTGFVDVNDAEGFDIYEVHSGNDNPKHPGSFLVRVKVRGV